MPRFVILTNTPSLTKNNSFTAIERLMQLIEYFTSPTTSEKQSPPKQLFLFYPYSHVRRWSSILNVFSDVRAEKIRVCKTPHRRAYKYSQLLQNEAWFMWIEQVEARRKVVYHRASKHAPQEISSKFFVKEKREISNRREIRGILHSKVYELIV